MSVKCRDARRRAFTGRDPLGATAAPLRHVPPDALPMSVLSAHEADGAHAIGQPTEQAWSSPFPTFPGFHGSAIAGQLAAPPADPRLAMPAGLSAQAQSRLQAYARGTTLTVLPTRQSPFRAPLLARITGQAGRANAHNAPGMPSTVWFFTRFRASPPLSLTYAISRCCGRMTTERSEYALASRIVTWDGR
jgi:hypothetical protein